MKYSLLIFFIVMILSGALLLNYSSQMAGDTQGAEDQAQADSSNNPSEEGSGENKPSVDDNSGEEAPQPEEKFTVNSLGEQTAYTQITLGHLFKAKEGASLGKISVTVTDPDGYTYTLSDGEIDWDAQVIDFTKAGNWTVVIKDDDSLCKETSISFEVKHAEKFTVKELGSFSAFTKITLADIFAAKEGMNIGKVTLTYSVTDLNNETTNLTVTSDSWTSQSIDLNKAGSYTLTIKDDDASCAPTTVTFEVSKTEKFVANSCLEFYAFTEIKLGKIFSAKNGVSISDVTATVTDPNGNVTTVAGSGAEWGNQIINLTAAGAWEIEIKDSDASCATAKASFTVGKAEKFTAETVEAQSAYTEIALGALFTDKGITIDGEVVARLYVGGTEIGTVSGTADDWMNKVVALTAGEWKVVIKDSDGSCAETSVSFTVNKAEKFVGSTANKDAFTTVTLVDLFDLGENMTVGSEVYAKVYVGEELYREINSSDWENENIYLHTKGAWTVEIWDNDTSCSLTKAYINVNVAQKFKAFENIASRDAFTTITLSDIFENTAELKGTVYVTIIINGSEQSDRLELNAESWSTTPISLTAGEWQFKIIDSDESSSSTSSSKFTVNTVKKFTAKDVANQKAYTEINLNELFSVVEGMNMGKVSITYSVDGGNPTTGSVSDFSAHKLELTAAGEWTVTIKDDDASCAETTVTFTVDKAEKFSANTIDGKTAFTSIKLSEIFSLNSGMSTAKVSATATNADGVTFNITDSTDWANEAFYLNMAGEWQFKIIDSDASCAETAATFIVAAGEKFTANKVETQSAYTKITLGQLFSHKEGITLVDNVIAVVCCGENVVKTIEAAGSDWAEQPIDLTAGEWKVVINDSDDSCAETTSVTFTVNKAEKFVGTTDEREAFSDITLKDLFTVKEGLTAGDEAYVEVYLGEEIVYEGTVEIWAEHVVNLSSQGNWTVKIYDNNDVSCAATSAYIKVGTAEKFTVKNTEVPTFDAYGTIYLGDLFELDGDALTSAVIVTVNDFVTYFVTSAWEEHPIYLDTTGDWTVKIRYNDDSCAPTTATFKVVAVEKFESVASESYNAYETIYLGDLFNIVGSELEYDIVTVVNGGEICLANDNWERNQITIPGGNDTYTISIKYDDGCCKATEVKFTVNSVVKFTANENITNKWSAYDEVSLGELFSGTNVVGDVTASFIINGISSPVTGTKDDWSTLKFRFTQSGEWTIKITDNVSCVTTEIAVSVDQVEKFDDKTVTGHQAFTPITLGQLFDANGIDIVGNVTATVYLGEEQFGEPIEGTSDNWSTQSFTPNCIGDWKVVIKDSDTSCAETTATFNVVAGYKFEEITVESQKAFTTIPLTELFSVVDGLSIVNNVQVTVTVDGAAHNTFTCDYSTESISLDKAGAWNVVIKELDNSCAKTSVSFTVEEAEKFTVNYTEIPTYDAYSEVKLGDLFKEIGDVKLTDNVLVSINGGEAFTVSEWASHTIIPSGQTGQWTVSIRFDNDSCDKTIAYFNVLAVEKFMSDASGSYDAYSQITLGQLFSIKDTALDDCDVLVSINNGEFTSVEDWANSPITIPGGNNTYTISIKYDDECCKATEVKFNVNPIEKFKPLSDLNEKWAVKGVVGIYDIFEAIVDADYVVDGGVVVTLTSPAGNTVTLTNSETYSFNEYGKWTASITDGNSCISTSTSFEVRKEDKFTAVSPVEDMKAFSPVYLNKLFTGVDGASIGDVTVIVLYNGEQFAKILCSGTDWETQSFIPNAIGAWTVTICDSDSAEVENEINVVSVEMFKSEIDNNTTYSAYDKKILGNLFSINGTALDDYDVLVSINGGVYTSVDNWADYAIELNALGSWTVSIKYDTDACNATTITFNVKTVDKFKFEENTGLQVYSEITISDLFSIINNLDAGNINVKVTDPAGTETIYYATDDKLTFNIDGTWKFVVSDDDELTNDAEGEIKVSLANMFKKKFNGDFLYRVGNQNTVSVGNIFGLIDEDITPSNIIININDVAGNADGTYASNDDTWTDGTIQFTGTGVVKVTISADGCNPVELYLEVIDATNLTSASGTTTGGDFVLLCDVNTTSYVYYWNSTVYGNGFTYSLKGAPTNYSSSHGHGVLITKNAVLDNLVIVGDVYDEYGAYTTNNDYNAAIDILGETVIQNCYISGCSAPVSTRANVTIVNTTLYGGAVANLIIKSGTATLENVTTVNYNDGRDLVGMGIVVHSDATESAKLVINGTLTQYNFIKESDTPSNTYAKNIHNAMFGDSCSQYHFSDGTDTYVNTGIISLTSTFDSADITDNANTGYNGSAVTLASYDGYVYTQPNSNGSVNNNYNMDTDTKVSTTQGAVPPSYSFDYDKNYVAKEDGSNDYCYYENGIVYISMDEGDSFNWDTSILTIGKNITVYTVSMNGTDYTGTSITFNSAGDYTVVYTYTDSSNYKLDENGNITTYEVTYTKTVNISVAVIKATTKHAEFTMGSSNVATEKITIDNATYISATGVTADNSTWTYITINGQNIYYPIIAAKLTSTKGSSTYAYFPVFENAITITDYADGGTGTEIAYNSSMVTLPSGLTAVKGVYMAASGVTWSNLTDSNLTQSGASNIFKWASSSSAPSDPEIYNNVLCFKSPKISADRDAYITLVQYSYTDEANTTYYYYVGYTLEAFTKSCVTPDTLITLADGSKKEIQYLNVGEEVVAWNFYTGKYEVLPISLLQTHGTGLQNVLHLYFEDGTELKILGEHGVFDADLNTFVFIDEDDVENYIGHSFVKQDGEKFATVKLVNYVVTTEYTTAYTILSSGHYNVLAEGMFTVTPAHVGDNFFNPFDIGEDMKYDEEAVKADIEKYGLYTYEDFDHVLTYEQFVALNLGHFKVSVGKGYVTYDGLIYLIETFINNEDFNV